MWQPIETFAGNDRHEVDIWMEWGASPLTMGMADAFRVVDAYRVDGKWYHIHEGKETRLAQEYITHWMPTPQPPAGSIAARWHARTCVAS